MALNYIGGKVPVKPDKPGFQTSEFLLSAIVIICATILLGFDKISSTEWSTMVGGVTGAYAIARTVQKAR